MTAIIPQADYPTNYSADARQLLDTQIDFCDYDGDQQSYYLRDLPHQYVFDLYEDHCAEDPEMVAENVAENEYHPGYCPDRILDIRGELLVNGEFPGVIHIGETEGGFEDWSSGLHGDGHYDEGVPGIYHWCKAHCKGMWIITSNQHVKSWDLPFDVYVTFLDPADEAAFKAKWGKAA